MGIFAKLFGRKNEKNNKERKNDYTPPICSATTSIKIETPAQKAETSLKTENRYRNTEKAHVTVIDKKTSTEKSNSSTVNASNINTKGKESLEAKKETAVEKNVNVAKAAEAKASDYQAATNVKSAQAQRSALSKQDAAQKLTEQRDVNDDVSEAESVKVAVLVNEDKEAEAVKIHSAAKKAVVIKKKAVEKPTETAKKTVEDVSDIAADIGAENDEKVLGGCFEIKKTRDDRYVFNLYASNHVIVATSQVYSSSAAALNGIKSVMTNASKAGVEDQTLKDCKALPYPKWEIYEDVGGKYRFRLSASNGNCICHSQGYTKKANCKGGIESIKKFAPGAKISKSYLKKAPNANT